MGYLTTKLTGVIESTIVEVSDKIDKVDKKFDAKFARVDPQMKDMELEMEKIN